MSKVYDVITDRIVAQLEAGTVPWRKPWNGQAGMPKNLVSSKEYRGINPFMLHCLGYESPYFLTFKQAKKLDGHVRKGEKGCPVVFWKTWHVEHTENGEKTAQKRFVLRYYTVFNVAQCEGVEAPTIAVPEREHEPLQAAEALVGAMPTPPGIVRGYVSAAYSPRTDIVRMPKPERFETAEAFYSTLFHELTHSTGHTSRLDRKGITETVEYGSRTYSQEELVAEMGSAFLCGETGILDTRIDQSAAYIDGWLRSLRNDRKLVVTAAAQAQKAADYILNRSFQTEGAS